MYPYIFFKSLLFIPFLDKRREQLGEDIFARPLMELLQRVLRS